MEKVRLGILGPGRIVQNVMRDLRKAGHISLQAVASRSIERAKEAAARYGAPIAYGSYEELAESREVDLVYIATPHNFHAEQALLMMEHGKHVICEKPLTTSEKDTRRLIECAKKNGVFLMEAMWPRFFPATEKLRQVLEAGAIGPIRHIVADFCYSCEYDPESRAFAPALAGGALLDLGVYPLMGATMLLGWQPESYSAQCAKAETGVDMRTAMSLRFQCGATAQLFCGMDAQSDCAMRLYGPKGFIEVPRFYWPVRFTLHTDDKETPYVFPDEDKGYHYEFEHAALCILAGKKESPLMKWEESLAVARICTDMRREMGIVYPWE